MILKAKSLKTNPLFWIAIAALVYGGFLFLVSGISIKSLIALSVGGWLFVQTTAPALGGKVKDRFINWIKDIISDAASNPVETVTTAIGSGPSEDVYISRPRGFSDAFKDDDFDAIAHLAYEAKKNKNDAAVEQLRSVNNEFFNISLNRIEADEDKTTA